MSAANPSTSAGHAPVFCAWCGTEMPRQQRGRPRKFCSRSCRQRSYEQRAAHTAAAPGHAAAAGGARTAKTTAGETGSATAPGRAAGGLSDQLFELRCAAEDVVTAIDEGADTAEVRAMATDLVQLAHRAEKTASQ